jgi:hypothetical protein
MRVPLLDGWVACLGWCALAVTQVAASAQNDGDSVLLLCSDDQLPAGLACIDLTEAVQKELSDLDITVQTGPVPTSLSVDGAAPTEIVEAVEQTGCASVIWVSASQDSLSLSVHTPGSMQPVVEIEPQTDTEGSLDLRDVSFRLRTLIAASLFKDLPGLEVTENPPEEPAEPEEPEEVEEPPPIIDDEPEPAVTLKARRPWTKLDAGYLLASYPTQSHWYHGMMFSVGILPLPRLEIFVDAGITFPNRLDLGLDSTGERMVIDNAQYLVGLGLGYSFDLGSRVRLTPRAGFHLGVSDTSVRSPRERRLRELNTAIWGGIELRVVIVSWLSLSVGYIAENLFNFEYLLDKSGPEDVTVFSLSQFRMGIHVGLAMRF